MCHHLKPINIEFFYIVQLVGVIMCLWACILRHLLFSLIYRVNSFQVKKYFDDINGNKHYGTYHQIVYFKTSPMYSNFFLGKYELVNIGFTQKI